MNGMGSMHWDFLSNDSWFWIVWFWLVVVLPPESMIKSGMVSIMMSLLNMCLGMWIQFVSV